MTCVFAVSCFPQGLVPPDHEHGRCGHEPSEGLSQARSGDIGGHPRAQVSACHESDGETAKQEPRKVRLVPGIDEQARQSDGGKENREGDQLSLVLAKFEPKTQEGDHDDPASDAEKTRKQTTEKADEETGPPRWFRGVFIEPGSWAHGFCKKGTDGQNDEKPDKDLAQGSLRNDIGQACAQPYARQEGEHHGPDKMPVDGHAAAAVMEHCREAVGQQQRGQRHSLGLVLIQAQKEMKQRDKDDAATHAEQPRKGSARKACAETRGNLEPGGGGQWEPRLLD